MRIRNLWLNRMPNLASQDQLNKKHQPSQMPFFILTSDNGAIIGWGNLKLYDKVLLITFFYKFANGYIIVSNKVQPAKAWPSSSIKFLAITPASKFCRPCPPTWIMDNCFLRKLLNRVMFNHFNWNVLQRLQTIFLSATNNVCRKVSHLELLYSQNLTVKIKV